MEQLSTAKERAKVAASSAASLLKAALVTPPPTTALGNQQPGANPILSISPSTAAASTPSSVAAAASVSAAALSASLPSWSSFQSAALAAQSAALAGARQLKEKASVAAAAVAAEVEARARAAGAGAGGGGGSGARRRSSSEAQEALLAHELSGLGEGSELGLFDVKWKAALSVFPGCIAPPAGAGEGEQPRQQRYLAISRDRLLELSPHPSAPRLGVGQVCRNAHLSELGKASFSRKIPGRVTVYLRRTAPPENAPEGGGAADATPASLLIPYSYILDGGAEAADSFVAQLQQAVTDLAHH